MPVKNRIMSLKDNLRIKIEVSSELRYHYWPSLVKKFTERLSTPSVSSKL